MRKWRIVYFFRNDISCKFKFHSRFNLAFPYFFTPVSWSKAFRNKSYTFDSRYFNESQFVFEAWSYFGNSLFLVENRIKDRFNQNQCVDVFKLLIALRVEEVVLGRSICNGDNWFRTVENGTWSDVTAREGYDRCFGIFESRCRWR